MKTKITRKGNVTIVSMDGKVDYEAQEPLKKDLRKLLDPNKSDAAATKIIFNFEKLEFVGSSGISAFVQTLRNFNARSPQKPKYVGVKSEFKKVIQAFDPDQLFQFFDSEDDDGEGQISQ
jgi:anti-anti-sigma factor